MGDAELARLPGLRVVATPSVGYDHVDLEAAGRRSVWVCNVPDYCVEEMADSSLALLLALLRGVVALDRSVRDGRWDCSRRRAAPAARGTRASASSASAASGARSRPGPLPWASRCGPPIPPSPPTRSRQPASAPASLADLLAACEAVSLHAPLTSSTEGLLGAAELALMPHGAVLVNTARAGLVDQEALLAALADGRLAGAALDALPVEPPTAGHPAPQAPTLIVTPHAAWYSADAEGRSCAEACWPCAPSSRGARPRARSCSRDRSRPRRERRPRRARHRRRHGDRAGDGARVRPHRRARRHLRPPARAARGNPRGRRGGRR